MCLRWSQWSGYISLHWYSIMCWVDSDLDILLVQTWAWQDIRPLIVASGISWARGDLWTNKQTCWKQQRRIFAWHIIFLCSVDANSNTLESLITLVKKTMQWRCNHITFGQKTSALGLRETAAALGGADWPLFSNESFKMSILFSTAGVYWFSHCNYHPAVEE